MEKRNSSKMIIIVLAIVLIGSIIGGLVYYGGIGEQSTKSPKLPEDNTIVEAPADDEELSEDESQVDEVEDFDIAVGKESPDFTLLNLSGEEVSLSDYRGKIVMINFWATWCGFCKKEMPDMQRLSEENDDLVILAVDVMEEKSLVEDYIKEGGYDFEVVLDEKGEVAKNYLVSAFPTSYFVDKDGILLGGVPGMLTWERMNEILDNIKENE
jgi:thiol-disulfide isomerase/thioredoxin